MRLVALRGKWMNPATVIVKKLLEADDDPFDAMSYARSDATRYWHPVWQIDLKELRQFIRTLGYRVTSMYRRKRGAIAGILSPVQALPAEQQHFFNTQTPESVRVKRAVEVWLDQRFQEPMGSRLHFIVEVNQWDERLDFEIYKSVPSDTDKHGSDPHPYG